MKTTLILDPDAAAQLERRLRQRCGAPFNDVVNAASRQGLRALQEKPKPKRKIWTKPQSLDGSLIGPLDKVAEVLAIAEGDTFK